MRGSNPTQPFPASDPAIGTRLGEYDVLEVIGEGGMGVVYRGVQPIIQKRVAIKVLKPNMAGDELQVRRLADEAVAVNSIRHRNIIDIFSFGQLPDGRPYIVMEFLEGQPLDAYLRAAGRVSLSEAVALLIAICAPLGAAHRAGVVHRDLKPSNIFVCVTAAEERYLKLLDFGLAKKGLGLGGTTEQTSRAQVTGTPNYMAPEQARGNSVSARTDLYALGVLAYELVTGALPFVAPGPVEVLMLHVSGAIPSPRASEPRVPEALEQLITRLLAKNAEDRPESAEAVRAELIAMARGLEQSASYDSMNPISGEYLALPHRPMSTSEGLKPASPMSVDLHAATFVSQRTLRPSRWPYVAGALGVVVVALIALLLSLETLLPVSPVVAPPPPVIVAPPPAIVTPLPVAVAPLTLPIADEPPSTAPVASKRPVRAPPTVDELRRRVATLETALQKATAPGEDPDPSALTLLRKYKVEATMFDTAADRQKLAESLKAFERTFLQR